jgi:hypothetical protein
MENTAAMTKTEATEWVNDHTDEDELDGAELVEVFTALFERAPDAEDCETGLWSLLCAGLPWGPFFEYVIKTDACSQEIEAESADEAARLFAEDEFPGADINDVSDLFAKIERIGDGAWCWIEGKDAPDGARQSVGAV